MKRSSILAAAALLAAAASFPWHAAESQQAGREFTHADTLRGSNTPERAWWDVTFYDLHVRVSPSDSSIVGRNTITYTVAAPAREMQIDLQQPLEADSIVQAGSRLAYRRDGNALFATLVAPQARGQSRSLTVFYHGRPRVAKHAPWDGGFVWTTDSTGRTWVATAVEGLGASAWWPNKDLEAQEPDSQRISITVPDPMIDVSNGRLRSTVHNSDNTTTYEWFVADPINNYDVAVNAGQYAHFGDTYAGEAGTLSLDYWPMQYNLERARAQFVQVKPMLACFEHWFGPYPWYRDGYKLVETPHLGMEHQSAVAYGNRYENGYLGRDLSGTGLGLKWDFIIIHESAHEWWGNSITAQDHADMWIHESFANYAENLYTECQQGNAAGAAYVIGTRKLIKNDRPIVGHFNVNDEGSGDMYYKGGNMLHTIRQIVNDDEKWRGILRGLNKEFWHRVVSGTQLEQYISSHAGLDLSKVFQQYLTTTVIPVLEYRIRGDTLSYHWVNVVPGFAMPVKVSLTDGATTFINPTEQWKTATLGLASPQTFHVDENFYVSSRNTDQTVVTR
ncbi:MAG: M1 family metallopeptidase [Gemmatimonadota bacterium]|nr:M1 family metallopeptidase [Gemmatimonadota bacterium]